MGLLDGRNEYERRARRAEIEFFEFSAGIFRYRKRRDALPTRKRSSVWDYDHRGARTHAWAYGLRHSVRQRSHDGAERYDAASGNLCAPSGMAADLRYGWRYSSRHAQKAARSRGGGPYAGDRLSLPVSRLRTYRQNSGRLRARPGLMASKALSDDI